MVQMTNLRDVRGGKRPKVAVVYEDVTSGFRFADWFAQHGYQATMTSAVHQLERNLRNLRELRPDVIVVGFSAGPPTLHSTLPRLRTTCPHVPIIAVVDPTAALSRNTTESTVAQPIGTDVFMCHSLDPPLA